MATYYSDYQTAVRAAANGSLHTRAKEKQVAQKVKYARFTHTGLGTEATGEYLELGSLNCAKARVIPELFRIRLSGTGNFSVPVKLAKANAAGTVVDLTTSVSFTQAALYTGVAATTGDLVDIARTDVLRLVFGTVVTAPPVGRFWILEVAYFDEN